MSKVTDKNGWRCDRNLMSFLKALMIMNIDRDSANKWLGSNYDHKRI